jgi:hypothetical protein
MTCGFSSRFQRRRHRGTLQSSRKSWECEDDGAATYLVWWMINFPGRGSGLLLEGQALRNWWEPIARFDAVVASGKGLLR